MDEDRVDVGHVDPALDDRRAEEHVRFVAQEGVDPVFELVLLHLAVGHHDPRLGHHAPQRLAHRLDRAHAVVEEEDLAPAAYLAQDRLANQPLVEAADLGPDRQAVDGRRFDDGEIADPGEGHLQRARNRRRGERQDVDGLLQLLDPLFVRDAEALLFIHDEESEVLELDILLEDAVGRNHDVDLARRESFESRLRVLRRAEARQHVDPDGMGGETLLEILEMLLA